MTSTSDVPFDNKGVSSRAMFRGWIRVGRTDGSFGTKVRGRMVVRGKNKTWGFGRVVD